MDFDKTEKALLEDAIVLLGGSLGFSIGLFGFGIDFAIRILSLMVGLALMALSSYDVLRISFDFHLKTKLKAFIHNTKGLAWIWIVGFGLTIPFCAFIYWVLAYPFEIIAESAMGMMTLTGTMAYSWVLTKFMISYMLAFVVIFAVIWVIINSKSPQGVY
jgi:hypothetical protein